MRFDLKKELRELLTDDEVRRRMLEALLKEATIGNKSGSVIRAFELVREIMEEEAAAAEVETENPKDYAQYTDEELKTMLRELEGKENGKL